MKWFDIIIGYITLFFRCLKAGTLEENLTLFEHIETNKKSAALDILELTYEDHQEARIRQKFKKHYELHAYHLDRLNLGHYKKNYVLKALELLDNQVEKSKDVEALLESLEGKEDYIPDLISILNTNTDEKVAMTKIYPSDMDNIIEAYRACSLKYLDGMSDLSPEALCHSLEGMTKGMLHNIKLDEYDKSLKMSRLLFGALLVQIENLTDYTYQENILKKASKKDEQDSVNQNQSNMLLSRFGPQHILIKTRDFKFLETEAQAYTSGHFEVLKSTPEIREYFGDNGRWTKKSKRTVQVFELNIDGKPGRWLGMFRADFSSGMRLLPQNESGADKVWLEIDPTNLGNIEIPLGNLQTLVGKSSLDKTYCITDSSKTYLGEFRYLSNQVYNEVVRLLPTKASRDYSKSVIDKIVDEMWEDQPFMLMKIVPIGGDEVVIDLDEVTYNGSWSMGDLTVYDNYEKDLFETSDKVFGEVFLNGRSMGQFEITNWETSMTLSRCNDCSVENDNVLLNAQTGLKVNIPEDLTVGSTKPKKKNTSIIKYTPKAKPKTVNDNTFTRLNTL